MVRLHSLYPWHTGGAYRQFMTEDDHAMMNWVLELNKFDLYTKDRDAVSGSTMMLCWGQDILHRADILQNQIRQNKE